MGKDSNFLEKIAIFLKIAIFFKDSIFFNESNFFFKITFLGGKKLVEKSGNLCPELIIAGLVDYLSKQFQHHITPAILYHLLYTLSNMIIIVGIPCVLHATLIVGLDTGALVDCISCLQHTQH